MSRKSLMLMLLLAGCGAQSKDEYAGAVPSQSALSINVPEGGTTDSANSSALLGDKASLYSFTRMVSRCRQLQWPERTSSLRIRRVGEGD